MRTSKRFFAESNYACDWAASSQLQVAGEVNALCSSPYLQVASEVMDALCVKEASDDIGGLEAGESLEVLRHGGVVLTLVVQMVTPPAGMRGSRGPGESGSTLEQES